MTSSQPRPGSAGSATTMPSGRSPTASASEGKSATSIPAATSWPIRPVASLTAPGRPVCVTISIRRGGAGRSRESSVTGSPQGPEEELDVAGGAGHAARPFGPDGEADSLGRRPNRGYRFSPLLGAAHDAVSAQPLAPDLELGFDQQDQV